MRLSSRFTNHLVMAALALAGLLALIPAGAQAHRSWLLPSAAQLNGKDLYVTVDAATSDEVFQLDAFALKLDGLTIMDPDGATIAPQSQATGKFRNVFDLNLTKDGTYRICVVSDTVMGSFMQGDQMKRIRGMASEAASLIPKEATDVQISHMISRVETFVTANAANSTALKPTGAGLEILPVTHPSEFVAGETAVFQAWLDGKPLSGLAVQIVPGAARYRGALKDINLTTDANGRFEVTWPQGQMYWIGASYPPRPAASEGAPMNTKAEMPAKRWSDALTVEVLPF